MTNQKPGIHSKDSSLKFSITFIAICLSLISSLLLPFRAKAACSAAPAISNFFEPKELVSLLENTDTSNMPQTLVAAYYSVRDNWNTTLMLNHKGGKLLTVQVTLFSLARQRYDLQPLTLQPTSFRLVNLNNIVSAAGPEFLEGSLQVSYTGLPLLIGAQLEMVDAGRGLIFDERLAKPASVFPSSQLEGLWWLPNRRAEMSLALSNTSETQLTANIELEGISPKQRDPITVTLQAHETRVFNVPEELLDQPHSSLKTIGGSSIQHSGGKGALLAKGMIKDNDSGFSSKVVFFSPQKAKSNHLHGAGLRLTTERRCPFTYRHSAKFKQCADYHFGAVALQQNRRHNRHNIFAANTDSGR